MELNELKSTWKKSELELKSPSELQKMTQINHHPMLKRIRAKLMIESILLVVFISVYYNMFDGHEKPLWANVLLVISAFLYVLNDLLGYLNSKNLRLTENTKKTLDQLIIKLKRLSIFLHIILLVFWSFDSLIFHFIC